MAIYHLNAKVGKKKNGDSGGAKSEYIEREGKYRNDADEVLYKTSGNMPAWAKKRPGDYWKSADKHERQNAKLYYELEFALPKELNQKQQIKLAKSFVNDLAEQPKDAGELPYTLAIHKGDGENPHCHVLLSERGNDGIDRDSQLWFKRANKKAPHRGGAAKTRSLQPKEWLLKTRESWAEYANQALEKAGHDETKIDHRSYADQGVEKIPGIHLGPAASQMEERGIRTERGELVLEREKMGIEYEKLMRERKNVEIKINSSRQVEAGQGHRNSGGTDRAVGAIDGAVDRKHLERHRKPGDGSQNSVGEKLAETDLDSRGTGGDYSSSTGRIADLAAGSRERTAKNNSDAAENEPDAGEYRISGAGARRRVPVSTWFTSASKRKKEARNLRDAQEAKTKADRTKEAVENQLRAMNCRRYDVGVRDSNSGKMMNKEGLTWEEILEKRLQWLKYMNYKGNDIYIRPAKNEKHGLVLVDDVEGWNVDEMRDFGHNPCCVVETSPGNCQAWIKIETQEGVSEAHRDEIAKKLAQSYGGDPASADARHYGRLAGFTNRKEKHEDKYGRQPYCLLRDSNGRAAPKGASLVQEAAQDIETRAVKSMQKYRAMSIVDLPVPRSSERLPAKKEYRRNMKQLHDRYGDQIDWSRADYMTAKSMLKSGYDANEIKNVMAEDSPGIESRKQGHIDDYVHRTVDKAQADPDVQVALKKLEEKENPL